MPKRQSFYGWHITRALAITQTIGFGVLYYAFSVFIKPMEAELGWTRAQTSAAFSIALLISGLMALPVGRYADKHGARFLMTTGSILGTLLVFAWSYTHSLAQFYLIQAGIGLAMSAVLYEVAFTVMAVWFRRKRPQAMLIITLVAGLASTIFIPLATYLTETLPWRDALRILALIHGLGTIPLHAFVLRQNPQKLGLEPDGYAPNSSTSYSKPERSISPGAAIREAPYWWLTSALGLARITIIAIAAHSVPMLLEQGYSPALVAAATGSIGLMQLTGRVFFTPLMGRVSLVLLTAGVFLTHSLALLSLLLIPGGLGLWLFTILFGFANGSSTLARAALLAEIYGPANYGSISGSMISLIAIFQTIAPLGAGLLHDHFHSYTPVLIILSICSGLAALATLQVNHTKDISYAD